MAISFPASPTTNDVYTYGGRSWIWNGYAWQVYPSSFTSGLTVGASTISGGAAGQIVYDSGGIFNEATGITTNGTSTLNIASTLNLGVQGTTQGSLVLGNTATTFSTTLQSSNSSTAAWTLTLPVAPPAANGYLLSSTTGGVTSWIAAPASGITINTTSITGGTSGNFLYDNAGTVGEKAPGTGVATAFGNAVNTAGGFVVPAAALTANALIIGGGSGIGPSTTTTGTGVVTAIGNNTNSANGLAVLNGSGVLAIGQGGTGSASFSAGYVVFGGAGGTSLSQDTTASNQFFWDATNHRLGIGTNAPSVALEVATDSKFNGIFVGTGGSVGYNNLIVSDNALSAVTTGTANTAVGTATLSSNTSGYANSAFGRGALYKNQTGNNNTAIGNSTLNNSVGASNNVAVGENCLVTNISGASNCGIGTECLSFNISGNYNSAVGTRALYNSTGNNNTSVGYFSLYNNFTDNNTSVGYYSLYTNTTGTPNTAIGYNSLYTNSSGSNNVAVGDSALYLSTTSNNTAIGSQSLTGVNTGSNNTAIGKSSGSAITSGSNNVVIGSYTGSAAPISASNSNYIVLSDGAGNVRGFFDNLGHFAVGLTSPLLDASTVQVNIDQSAFVIGIETTTALTTTVYPMMFRNPNGQVGAISVNGSTTTYNTSSDYRLKENVQPMVNSLDKVNRLKPVTFNWKVDGTNVMSFKK